MQVASWAGAPASARLGTGGRIGMRGQVLRDARFSLRGCSPAGEPGREGSRDHSKDDKSLSNRNPSWQMVRGLLGPGLGEESPSPWEPQSLETSGANGAFLSQQQQQQQ